MEELQLSQEEIAQLREIQNTQESLITNFGSLEYQLQSLELQKETIIEQLEVLKHKETELGAALNEKYGNGTINIETGVFTKGT